MRGGGTGGGTGEAYGCPAGGTVRLMPDAPLPDGVSGWCESRFSAVARVLSDQLAAGAHHGAAVAVHHRGVPVVDLWGGAFGEDTLALSFSTTKGPVAIALHMALERAGVPYDTAVAEVWPEFAQAGKAEVTIRQCLCHEAGIPQIRNEVPDVRATADWDAMVATVERLRPLWEPGTANGYHAFTWGWLAGELLERVDGRPLPTFLAEEIAGPLGLDGCFVGVPPADEHRLAPVHLDPAYRDMPPLENLLPADSVTLQALSPRGDLVDFVNSELGRRACVPAITGAFTARSLATISAALERGGRLGRVALLERSTLEAATTVQSTRPDRVLFMPMGWRLGFMSMEPSGATSGASGGPFGHAGLGGSLAMADPGSELAVAVTLDRLELDLLGDRRGRAVVEAARAAAAA